MRRILLEDLEHLIQLLVVVQRVGLALAMRLVVEAYLEVLGLRVAPCLVLLSLPQLVSVVDSAQLAIRLVDLE